MGCTPCSVGTPATSSATLDTISYVLCSESCDDRSRGPLSPPWWVPTTMTEARNPDSSQDSGPRPQDQRFLVLEVVVQPDVTRGVVGCDRATVGADEFGDSIRGVVGAGRVQVSGPDRSTVDAPARVDDRRIEGTFEDGLAGVAAAVDTDQIDQIRQARAIDDARRGQRHVIRVEIAAHHVREALQQVLPQAGRDVGLPFARGLVDHGDIRILLDDLLEAIVAA